MHRPSWMRRTKKPKTKAKDPTTSDSASLSFQVSNLAITSESGASIIPETSHETHGSLWDQAYKDLLAENDDLVQAFEKLLLSEPEVEPTTGAAEDDPARREKQMSRLVDKKLSAMKEDQWKLHIRGKSIEVRQQVDRIVKVVLVGKDFITSVASMDPIHAGLPWAGVCVLLPLLTKDSVQQTAATDGLEYISGLIRRYTELEQIYLSGEKFVLKTDLADTVRKLYQHILEYEARAACQFSRNVASQWARNLVEADSWKGILESIRELDAACDKLIGLIDAKDQHVRAARLETFLKSQNQEVKDLLKASHMQDEEHGKVHLTELRASREEQQEWHRKAAESGCYECLRTTDYEANKDKNPDRIPGTCEWFLRHPRYLKWLGEQGSAWLWVTADPGCDTQNICYYFFKDDSEENRSATHALCAILHQLFSQNAGLVKHAIPAYKRNSTKLAHLFNELWSIFLSAAADPHAGCIICVLDGLDECAESSRLPIIRNLARFYREPEVTTKLKFIIVSRPYSSIGDAFWEENPDIASVQLQGESESEREAIRVEIDLVIKEKVKQFNSLRCRRKVVDDAHLVVQKHLDSVENRTYLWVSLIFPELQKAAGLAKSKLLQIIKSVPKTVDEAYERILNQSSDTTQARKLLHIVVAAKRPLNLAEMNIALSIEETSSSIEDLELEPESSFQTTVRELCGLFVTIRDSKFYLIHQTAKEFLISDQPSDRGGDDAGGKQWRHSLEPAESNNVLAKICMSYLMFAVFETHPLVLDHNNSQSEEDSQESCISEEEEPEDETMKYCKEHQLLEYAANHWFSHLREAESMEDPATLHKALTICTSHSRRLSTWFKVHWACESPYSLHLEDLTDLMVASYIRLKRLIEVCLDRGADVNAKDSPYGNTPLFFAAEYSDDITVKTLLENGAEVNTRNVHGSTPLILAAEERKLRS